MKIVAFWSGVAGAGTTSLVYHLATMYRELGLRVLAVDFDPQARLTARFLDEDRLENLWEDATQSLTLERVDQGGDFPQASIVEADEISLLPASFGLMAWEERLARNWLKAIDGDEIALERVAAVHELLPAAGRQVGADLVLVDLGASLGPLNRAALFAADQSVAVMTFGLESVEALRVLTSIWKEWRGEGRALMQQAEWPASAHRPLGFSWAGHVLTKSGQGSVSTPWMDAFEDSVHICYRLAVLKSYAGLEDLAREARKPKFLLRPADGALGSLAAAAQSCRVEYQDLARHLLERIGAGNLLTKIGGG